MPPVFKQRAAPGTIEPLGDDAQAHGLDIGTHIIERTGKSTGDVYVRLFYFENEDDECTDEKAVCLVMDCEKAKDLIIGLAYSIGQAQVDLKNQTH